MRDKRDKGWFWIDNAIVDRTDLNIYEKMLYMCLARHAGEKDFCFPGLETLCRELGIKDTRTVVKYIRTLEEKGLIETKKEKGKSNKYYLNNVKVPTSDVPPTCDVPTCDVPSSSKVPTYNVPTSDDTTHMGCTHLPTWDVGSSTHMGCTSKKTNIKKTNKEDTTTIQDNINKIDPKTSEEDKNSSSSSIDLIKTMLEQHGISNNTKLNIMVLVKEDGITPERVGEVLKAAQVKHWQEGAIYTALRDNWKIDLESEQQEKQKQKERSAKIDEEIKKSSQEFQAVKDKVNAEHKEKEELMEYMRSLSQGTQASITNIAMIRAKEKYPFGFKTMFSTLVIYEVIREYKSGALKI